MYVARKVSICMLYKYDVLMKSALPFTVIFWQIQNKDVKVGSCSKFPPLKLPCFRSLIIEQLAPIVLHCILGFAKNNYERTKLIQMHKIN